MVFKCCVPNCRGNYKVDGTKVSVFGFPKDEELRKKWLAAIPRDFEVTKNSKVREMQFKENDIRKAVEFVCEKTGKKTVVPYEQPRLTKEAIPSIFPGCPEYMTKNEPIREEPEAKRKRIEMCQLESVLAESLELYEQHNVKFKVDTLIELIEKSSLVDLNGVFNPVSIENSFSFVKIKFVDQVPTYITVIVDQNLSLSVFIDNVKIKKLHDLTFPLIISNVQQISNVLCYLNKSNDLKFDNIPNLINSITVQLTELENLSSDNQKLGINFLKEQLSLLFTQKNQNRYSTDFLIFSSLFLSISPHAYNFLRSSGYVILPHHSTIKKLIMSYDISPKNESTEENFLSYIKQKFDYLTDADKTVTVMIDEVHLKPFFDFKGGDILGASYNSIEAANSAYVYMVQSVESSFKDVVAIMPVKTVNADALYEFIKKTLIGLETIGFHTFCVISDNNSINRKAMSKFSTPPKVQVEYPHPFDSSRKLFFIIDSVHIIKCVRNNWLNQKNYNSCMFYPEFQVDVTNDIDTNDNVKNVPLKTASFQALRKLHEFERSNLVKYAPTLITKSLFPSNIERQNVKLALNIFNRQLIGAINSLKEKCNILDLISTAEYIEIFVNWWDIMNVRTVTKGFHKRNEYQKPLRLNDFSFRYLSAFLEWLSLWGKAISDTGRLTSETHLALSLTTQGIQKICRYCTEELGLKFILAGKFQTDSLEARFGKYRQLAGGQYDISITQLYESEMKLRLQSTLPLILKSNVFGYVKIDLNNIENESEFLNSNLLCNNKFEINVTEEDLLQSNRIMPVIVYLAGYAVHSTLKFLKNCPFCKLLTRDEEILFHENNILIHHQDRGGLKYPVEEVITIGLYSYVIISKLLTEFEENFLKVHNQRIISLNIIKAVLNDEEKHLNFDYCDNEHSSDVVIHCIVKKFVNILLNNYCKLKNDSICYASHSKAKERKLKTLMKSTKNLS
uniref:Transposable element P transposase n=1 Tax=Parasteatoda tepidariorum TaxID=114398 RepID=A0A2L2Y813_PARTP